MNTQDSLPSNPSPERNSGITRRFFVLGVGAILSSCKKSPIISLEGSLGSILEERIEKFAFVLSQNRTLPWSIEGENKSINLPYSGGTYTIILKSLKGGSYIFTFSGTSSNGSFEYTYNSDTHMIESNVDSNLGEITGRLSHIQRVFQETYPHL